MRLSDISKYLARLAAPKSQSEDSRRQEYILNVLVLGAIVLSSIALTSSSIISLSRGQKAVPLVLVMLVVGTFLGLYIMSRKGLHRVAAYLLILLYFVPTTLTVLTWGIAVPQSLLTYALIIVLSAVLLGTRFAWIVTGTITITLLSAFTLEQSGQLVFDESWRDEAVMLGDAIVFSFTLFNILVVSWLSNREIEKSLARAHTSEQALAREKDVLEEKVEARTTELAALYESAHNTSTLMQQALILMPESIDGISFSHTYRSATEAALIGGDFYDLFEIGSGQIGIVMGDVSGKGVEAGALTALIKNTIKANALRDHSPASVMSYTNQAVCCVIEPHRFATVFFGVLNINSLKLAYCSAGHPHTILRRLGLIETIDFQNSPAVGLLEDLTFTEGYIQLQADDALILYTDGVFEAKGATDRFGEARLLEFLRGNTANSVSGRAQAVQQAVIKFTDNSLTDDLAVLAITPDSRNVK